MTVTTSIRATSRASIKIKDSFYTVEWCEERSINDGDDLEEERKKLWDTCNAEVDDQLDEIVKTFSQK